MRRKNSKIETFRQQVPMMNNTSENHPVCYIALVPDLAA
jgi:hypothetical protein